MTRYLVFLSGAVIVMVSAGCAGRPLSNAPATVSEAISTPSPQEFATRALRWRQEAREFRKLADRHDIEARMLSQSPALLDQKLLERKRVLAQQLRIAADQAEQRAQEAERQVPHGMIQ